MQDFGIIAFFFWGACLVLMEFEKHSHSFVAFQPRLWIQHKKQQPLEAFDHRQLAKGAVNYQFLWILDVCRQNKFIGLVFFRRKWNTCLHLLFINVI